MTTSIDARDREVQSTFEKAHAIARGETTASLDHVETSLWTAMLALGRAMIALYLARVAARPRATEYVHAGSKFVFAGFASIEIGTRFGKVSFERAVGRRVGWRRATCDRPRARPVQRVQLVDGPVGDPAAPFAVDITAIRPAPTSRRAQPHIDKAIISRPARVGPRPGRVPPHGMQRMR